MNTDSAKNERLIKQFPFLSVILAEGMEPFGEPNHDLIHNLIIKVERADGDLMYYQAENIGLGEASFLCSSKKDRESQVGRVGEYLFAIGGNDEILNRLNWPKNDEEKRKSYMIYGHHVLWGSNSGSMYSNCLCDRTEYIVLVKVSAWYKDTRKDDRPSGRFGQFLGRHLGITVYIKPKQGFSKLREDASVYENLYLKSGILADGVIRKDIDYITICGMLGELARLFQDEVYSNGLKEMYDKFPTRGGSGIFGSVKVMATDLCGYDRIQLEDSNSWISFQKHDSSQWMSAIGMGGTLPQLRNLVKTVVKKWNESPDARLNFKSDGKISVL